MSQKIQFRRGATSEFGNTIFDQGEPIWDVNKKQLYIGDGFRTGGMSVAMISSGNPITVASPGVSGQFKVVGDKLYITTGNNLWGRINITTF